MKNELYAHRIPGYDLFERLGQGGMGTVYKARRQQDGRTVAVKISNPRVAGDPVLRKRFEHECEFSCRFQHPHLVAALEHGVADEVPYLVMEYVPGAALSRRIKERGKLSEKDALAIANQIGEALTFLHRYELVHRDVKPENILVAPDGQAKLADLGLIKDLASTSRLTRTSTGLGTFEYSAPEQYEDAKNADPRSDVFSLAATLYSALTGIFPFGSSGHMTILHRKLTNEFEAPRGVNPDVSETVNDAICRGLQAQRDDRPPTIADFFNMLHGKAPAAKTSPKAVSGKSQPAKVAGTKSGPAISKTRSDAAKRRTPNHDDRRVTIRFAVDLTSSCEPVQHGGRDNWKATIQDVSMQGFCLRVQRRFEVGTLLRVSISGLPQDAPDSHLVKVRWVKEHSPRVWHLGCALTQDLSEQVLDMMCFEGACKTHVG